jgi:hypothetical protein
VFDVCGGSEGTEPRGVVGLKIEDDVHGNIECTFSLQRNQLKLCQYVANTCTMVKPVRVFEQMSRGRGGMAASGENA